MLDLKAVQAMLAPMFPGLMGVRLTSLSPDKVEAEMPVRPDLCTAGGILHGGAFMAFADALGAGPAAAAAGGPVLLTAPGALPAVTAADLILPPPAEGSAAFKANRDGMLALIEGKVAGKVDA